MLPAWSSLQSLLRTFPCAFTGLRPCPASLLFFFLFSSAWWFSGASFAVPSFFPAFLSTLPIHLPARFSLPRLLRPVLVCASIWLLFGSSFFLPGPPSPFAPDAGPVRCLRAFESFLPLSRSVAFRLPYWVLFLTFTSSLVRAHHSRPLHCHRPFSDLFLPLSLLSDSPSATAGGGYLVLCRVNHFSYDTP